LRHPPITADGLAHQCPQMAGCRSCAGESGCPGSGIAAILVGSPAERTEFVNVADPERHTMRTAVERLALAEPSLLAIDGLPCSGKSTLAEMLRATLGATCIALDEFVLPKRDWPWDISPAFPFAYIRYGEFVSAIRSLAARGECSFTPFDWNTRDLAGARRIVTIESPVIVEGVSSLNPALRDLFDVGVFVDSDRATTLQAALDRGVGLWEREWRELFLPSVDLYMGTNPRSRADLLVSGRGV
jgi:hypothetical protein